VTVGRRLRWLIGGLVAAHAIILFAGFFAPYDPTTQSRAFSFAPPTRLHLVDAAGHLHVRPFVYEWKDATTGLGAYEEDTRRPLPLRFLVRGAPYNIAGVIPSQWHLFGVPDPGRAFLLGADRFGRDQLSRLLYGGQISILAGLLATSFSLGLGMIAGCVAGLFGRVADRTLMIGAELFLALPWLYLLLGVRAMLPLHLEPTQAFLLVASVIGLIGWAKPARLVRGIVLSAKERNYVLAARGFGASGPYLLRRHILPQTYGVLLTQATLLLPQYILAEVTLSFLGIGIAEPVPSWGNMLGALQEYNVLVSYWWMFAPVLALFPLFLGYFGLASTVQERTQTFTT
jgi:peptide/nickel transport system permease protein